MHGNDPRTSHIQETLDHMTLLCHLKRIYEALSLGIKVVFCCIAGNT